MVVPACTAISSPQSKCEKLGLARSLAAVSPSARVCSTRSAFHRGVRLLSRKNEKLNEQDKHCRTALEQKLEAQPEMSRKGEGASLVKDRCIENVSEVSLQQPLSVWSTLRLPHDQDTAADGEQTFSFGGPPNVGWTASAASSSHPMGLLVPGDVISIGQRGGAQIPGC